MRLPAPWLSVALVGWTLFAPAPAVRGDDEPAAPVESPYVRLLKSGKLPPERLGVAINGIGQRGGPDDLAYLFGRAVDPKGLPGALRAQALDAISDAVQNRKAMPKGGLDDLTKILDEPHPDPINARAALRLASVAKVVPTAARVREMAANPRREIGTRGLALDTLATLGGPADRVMIETLCGDPDLAVAARAVAALARLDVDAAAVRGARLMAAAGPTTDLAPMLAAFVDLRGGADRLADAIKRQPPPADAAKLALRSLHAIGHAEESLVSALSQVAGIATEAHALSAAEMAALVEEVATKGEPARGEAVFRRPDLNCAKCHSIAASGGGVGPDLSAVGVSSPIDYLANSILLPDLAIKEVYDTLMVLTEDGRVFQGIVVEKDDQRIVLRDATAELRTIPASSVEETKPGGSLMPKGLANLMTHAEFVDLVRFLSELGKPGPYAVQATPTIHRWRVLSEASAEELEGQTALPGNDDPRWLPIYSRASGDLPLEEAEALAKSTRLVLRAEVVATVGGAVQVRPAVAPGLRSNLDDQAVPLDKDGTVELKAGRHTLSFHIYPVVRKSQILRVEVVKPAGSSAEYTLVVGK